MRPPIVQESTIICIGGIFYLALRARKVSLVTKHSLGFREAKKDELKDVLVSGHKVDRQGIKNKEGIYEPENY